MYILRLALSIAVACLAAAAGCVGETGRASVPDRVFCTLENHVDEALGRALSARVVLLVSFHQVVVGSPGCPRFGMSYELVRGTAEADSATLDALAKAVDDASENYRSGNSRQAVEARFTGVIIREAAAPHAVVFRVQRADRIRLIPRPAAFDKAAQEALRGRGTSNE